jgi:hypothetical protein
MNLSDTEFEPDDMADDDPAEKTTILVSSRVLDKFHTDLRELVGDIPRVACAGAAPYHGSAAARSPPARHRWACTRARSRRLA